MFESGTDGQPHVFAKRVPELFVKKVKVYKGYPTDWLSLDTFKIIEVWKLDRRTRGRFIFIF
jgi:hypothetical protein